MKKIVPIEISARHIHLSQTDFEILFGPLYALQIERLISQPNQFACEETVQVIGPKNSFPSVRIIGPIRATTQLEITITDGYWLGIHPSVAVSGELFHSIGGVDIIGPKGKITLAKGVIVAQRHLHIEPSLAKQWQLKSGDLVSIKTRGTRSVIFGNVKVRSLDEVDSLSFMIDTDEANAAGIKPGDKGEIV